MPKTITKTWTRGSLLRTNYEKEIFSQGYIILSEVEYTEKNFDMVKTFCLGILFLPLALLGTKKTTKVKVMYKLDN